MGEWIVLLIVASAWAILTVFISLAALRGPKGYQDESRFHLGDPSEED